MSDPSSPAARKQRSPRFMGVLALGTVTLLFPILQWAAMAAGALGPMPPAGTWMRYVAVMAVFGAVAGAAMFLAERSGGRWARRYALAFFLAAVSVPGVDDFAQHSFFYFISKSVVVGLFSVLVGVWILYALGYPRR